MAVKIEFDTNTTPFLHLGTEEVVDILTSILSQIDQRFEPAGGTIRDHDGNEIGSWIVSIDATS